MLDDIIDACLLLSHDLQAANFWILGSASVSVWFAGYFIAGRDAASQKLAQACGYLSFLMYCILVVLCQQPFSGELIMAMVVRGGLCGLGAAGIVLIVVPMLIVVRCVLAFARRWLSRLLALPRRLWQQRIAAKNVERRAAIERQQSLQRAEIHRQAAEQRATAERLERELRRRRMDARAKCELFFNRCRTEIIARFTKKHLLDFMTRYMNDSEPADVVERRADELCTIMQHHRESLKANAQPTTIGDLASWFLQEKDSIESLPLDEEMKEEHLVHLNIRYSDLSQEILERMKP